MTPSARLAAAAEILDTLDFTRLVDPQLRAWGRTHRFAGSKDRRAIADRVYTCLRYLRSAATVAGASSGRALVLGSLRAADALEVGEIDSLAPGGYGLAPLTDAERDTLSASPRFESEAARLDWPDWLLPEAIRAFGAALGPELEALRERAPLDLRVNTLKASVADAITALEGEGHDPHPVAACDTARRLASGSNITTTEAFLNGWIEPQDAASQAVAAFAQPQPGTTVLDYCAGAGGKTLALAALMQNEGHLFAHDIDPRRMADLPERAKRSGATIIDRVTEADLAPASCETVLVDAPCSGSGSWRRDPLGKWRLTAERLATLQEAQREALGAAVNYVAPGGTITYATCSVLPSENSDQVEWLTTQRSDFALEGTLDLWPARDRTDGFFAAKFRRIA